jgi:hypothetical protein
MNCAAKRVPWACLALLAIAAFITPAEAQISIGGGSGLGVFSGVFNWFQSNMMEGLIVLGIMVVGISLLMLHFRISTVASICAGIAILANAVAIGTGAISAGALLGG